jgi:CheY-like chemotaxis protein
MCKVLIIDDEKAICDLLDRALAKFGFDAVTATSGSEGLAEFHRGRFDLVITDMLMPDGNGNNVARQIRTSRRPDTPIIGISGTAWLLDSHNFNAVFEKPMSIHALMDTVKDLTATQQQMTI